MTRSSIVNGTLGCFCDQQYAENGKAAMFQRYSAAPEQKGVAQGKICQDYYMSSIYKNYYYTISSASTFVSNTIFISIIEFLVIMVTFKSLIFQ